MKTQRFAVISGGGGYVGSAIAAALRAQDWKVVSLGRSAAGPDTVVCDITDAGAVRSTIEELVQSFGTVDACVHAAAPKQGGSLLTATPDEVRAVVDTAVLGGWYLARAVIPHMSPSGAFVGITSALIEPGVTPPSVGAYLPAKYGLRGLLRALALEVGNRTRVYAVAPGYMPGGLNEGMPELVLELFAKKTGAGKTTREEVARCVAQLCTGELPIPGGSSIAISGGVSSL
jgi:3-oxoacyl-[acyl-carrier protein] reductase